MAREVHPNFKKTPPRSAASAADDRRVEAETLGLLALAFVVEDDEGLMPRFLALSGLALDDLRARAQDPVLLGAVLDFLLAHEPDLLAFAALHELPPAAIARARRALPGGASEE
jgi:hypothetical protein